MDSSAMLLLLIALAAVIFLLLSPSKKRGAPPPGPRPWPVVGNLLQLGKTAPHAKLCEMAKIHGPLLSLRIGTELVVVASSPLMAAEVLRTHDRALSARFAPHTFRVPDYIEYSFGWAKCDEKWKALRAACKGQLFSAKSLDSQAQLREEKVSELLASVLEKQGEEVKLGELVFHAVFNMLGNTFFSRDMFGSERKEEAWALKGVMSRLMEMAVTPNIADIYPFLDCLDLQGLRREATVYNRKMHEALDAIMRERKEETGENCSSSKSDFLSVLLQAQFEDLRIKAFFMDMFAAGTETTVTTTDWVLSELIRHPEAMSTVREELERVVGDGDRVVKESHVVHLRYLAACIKEAFRLHPPVPLLIPRQATEDCKVQQYVIPKGCRLMVNVWAMGRDPGIWEDPLEFKPERFLESRFDYKGSDFEFIPFGAGRRICPGLPLASRLVPLILASLIHSLDWELPKGVQPEELNMREKFGLTLAREQPLVIVPKIG